MDSVYRRGIEEEERRGKQNHQTACLGVARLLGVLDRQQHLVQ